MSSSRFSVLRIYVYGLCPGTTDALPGVSGGTIALLLGIYTRLIDAMTSLTPARLLTVIQGYNHASREEAKHALDEMDLYTLVTLGLGMVTAVVVLAHLVTYLHRSFSVPLSGFFTGLIAASALVLYRELTLGRRHRSFLVRLDFCWPFSSPVGWWPFLAPATSRCF